jgi:hypothetical protein
VQSDEHEVPTPRVVDLDTGELLGGGPAPAVRERRSRPVVVLAVALALVAAAGVGAAWQRQRDQARDRDTVHVSLTLAGGSAGAQVESGAVIVPIQLSNSDSRPVTIGSVSVRRAGVAGRTAVGRQVAPAGSWTAEVPVRQRCGTTVGATVQAIVEVTAAGGARRTVTTPLDISGLLVDAGCPNPAPVSPEAVVTAVSGSGPAFTATVRLTMPMGTPATKVSVTATPYTPEPAPEVTVTGEHAVDLRVPLDASRACVRGESWDGLPTMFTVTADGQGDSVQSSLIIPFSLYRGLIHAIDTTCPR